MPVFLLSSRVNGALPGVGTILARMGAQLAILVSPLTLPVACVALPAAPCTTFSLIALLLPLSALSGAGVLAVAIPSTSICLH